MAYSSPRVWVAAETVTAAIMNSHIKDQFLHIAGTAGFTGSMSGTVGVQPVSGYFMGALGQNYHVEHGRTQLAAGTATVTFANAFASTAPSVIVCFSTGIGLDTAATAITGSQFTVTPATANDQYFNWIAMGAD